MTAISAVVRDALKASPAVAAIAGARVYRDERPEGSALPAIVILLVSDPRPRTFSGPQPLRRARLQIDCLALSRGDADALGEVVITWIDGAAIRGDRIDSVGIDNVRNDSSRDDPPTTFRTAIDAMVWHRP